LSKGLKKNRVERYRSADEMIASLERVLDGSFPVQCPMTFIKRGTRTFGRFVDRRPLAAFGVSVMTLGLVGFAFAELAGKLVH
jgi:hypothetical protein